MPVSPGDITSPKNHDSAVNLIDCAESALALARPADNAALKVIALMKQPPKKLQHTTPALHLRYFAGIKGQVWTIDKDGAPMRSAIPEETAKERHFYSVEREDGSFDTTIEDHLADVESKAAPVYAKLASGSIPDYSQERADFATFIALLYVRTPAMRRDAAEVIGRGIQIMNYAYGTHDGAFNTMVRNIEKKDGRAFSDEKKAKLREWLIDPTNYTLQIRKERTFIALKAADKLVPLLYEMTWTVVKPRHGFFITSDNPVTREVDPKTVHPFYGDHGFKNKTAQVTFPLSPEALLLMTWKSDLPPSISVNRRTVEHANRTRVYFADRYLYAHIASSPIQKLATKYKGSRPKMITKGFGPAQFTETQVPRRWSRAKASNRRNS
jgi:hypothetical protein